MKQVFEHWVGTGMDGFMLDWPQGYVGSRTTSGDASDSTIIQFIKSVVKPMGDIAVFGETYNADDTPWNYIQQFDGGIDGSFPTGRVQAKAVEYDLTYCDQMQKAGLTPRTPVEMPANGGSEAMQSGALAALLGGYYALHATGQKEVANGDYGDFGTWKGEDAFSVVLKAVQTDAALHPGASRTQVTSGSHKAYTALRTSADGKQHTLVAINFDKKNAKLYVDLSTTPIQAKQVCVDQLSTSSCPSVPTNRQWSITLPPHGYGVYKFTAGTVVV